jgi:hypothetical protein
MHIALLFLIVLLTIVICALAGFWFYRTAQARTQNDWSPQIAQRTARNIAWDRAVRAARNRNW